jgi:hypothetical protein
VGGYEGLRRRVKDMPPDREYLAEAGVRVMRLYQAWGKRGTAALWRVKLGGVPIP